MASGAFLGESSAVLLQESSAETDNQKSGRLSIGKFQKPKLSKIGSLVSDPTMEMMLEES